MHSSNLKPKYMKNSFYVILCLIAGIACSCGKTEEPGSSVTVNANSFVVTGGPFLNSLFNSGTLTRDTGSYSLSANMTTGNIQWHSGTPFVLVQINFKGNKAGTFTLGPTATTADTNAVNILYTNNTGGTSRFLSQSGTLTVTEYDAVNGVIKGTYGGVFEDTNGELFDISNGSFSETRGADTK